jgi:hypothetical protein
MVSCLPIPGSLKPARILAAIAIFAALLTGCGGSGGKDAPGTPPPGQSVAVSGRITFDRVPFNSTIESGLNLSNPIRSPSRHVVVEAIDAGSRQVLASTTTDASGEYRLSVPANRSIFIRAKAQMLKAGSAPTWNFRVLNNTNDDALYALDSATFDSGANGSTRDLHAATGWSGASYTGTRAAAPFAILDTVYQAKELVLSAVPTATFEGLDLFWSVNNRPATPLCPDDGYIETTFYVTGGVDECDAPGDLPPGIYILGAFESGNGDTDEFDSHVIAHEFGHYYEDQFSRSDSIGGSHPQGSRLDLRVAFGEGWGNAYAAMALNDPVYRDSYSGGAVDYGFDIEADGTTAEGWFSESSIAEIVWDIFDPANEAGDPVALGFAPIHTAMTTAQVDADAFASIYTFSNALRARNAAAAAGINTLLANERIAVTGDFGEGETNDGGDAAALPIYTSIGINQNRTVCMHGQNADLNRLGNNRFFTLSLGARSLVTLHAAGVVDDAGTIPAGDPDLFVYLKGQLVAASEQGGATETIQQLELDPGTYVIEIYDFDSRGNTSTRCANLAVTGL